MRDLTLTLQRLYDSEINVTITWLWDGGVDFAFLCTLDWRTATREDWHNVQRVDELAEALHKAAIAKYPTSEYAKLYS